MCANHSEWKLDAHPLSFFSAGTHERYCGHLPKFVTMVAPQTHESGVTSVTNIRYIHLSLIHISPPYYIHKFLQVSPVTGHLTWSQRVALRDVIKSNKPREGSSAGLEWLGILAIHGQEHETQSMHSHRSSSSL